MGMNPKSAPEPYDAMDCKSKSASTQLKTSTEHTEILFVCGYIDDSNSLISGTGNA